MKETEYLLPNSGKGTSNIVHGTIITSFLGLFSTMAGAGILALPSTLRQIGVVPGFIIMFIVAVITWSSIYYLCRCADFTGEYSFEGLSTRLLSPFGVWVVRIFTLLLIFGACVMYFVIAMDLLTPLLDGYIARSTIGIVFMVISVPLCLPDSIYSLRYTNSVVLLCLVYVTIALFIRTVYSGSLSLTNPESSSTNSTLKDDYIQFNAITTLENVIYGISYTLPIHVLSFCSQINSVRAYGELPNKADMKIVNLLLVSGGFIFYGIFAVLGYVCFHGQPLDDVLSGFSEHDGLINGARVALALCMLCKTPISFQPFREVLELCCLGHGRKNMLFRIISTIVFLVVASVLAIVLASLSRVMDIMGATTGILISFSVPGFFLKEVACGFLDGERLDSLKAPAYGLIYCGIVFTIISLYYVIGSW